MTDNKDFEKWFFNSKYTQVVLPTEADIQRAWDAWQVSIKNQDNIKPEVQEVEPVAVVLDAGRTSNSYGYGTYLSSIVSKKMLWRGASLYLAPQAAPPDTTALREFGEKCAKQAIQQCKNATGLHNQIDTYVSPLAIVDQLIKEMK